MSNPISRQPASDEPERPNQTTTQQDNNEDLEKIRAPWVVVAVFLSTATLILALLAWSRSSATLLFIELLVGAAALSVGGFLGFLFGMPRGRIRDETPDEQAKTDAASIDYQPSDNLKEISDWLTKILIGVGLVELKELRGVLGAIGQAVENSSAGALTGTSVITQAVLIVFLVLGFYASFLWTRIYYGPLQTLTDNQVIRRLRNQVVTLKRVAKQFREGEIATPATTSPKEEMGEMKGDSEDPIGWDENVLKKIKEFRESKRDWYSNPSKKIFGKRPQEDNGRRLEPKFIADLETTVVIDLIVRRVSRNAEPLVGPVAFLLHPTFTQSVWYVQADGDSATLNFSPGGWFTVVAIMDKGDTILSYDLNKLPNVPRWFKEN